MAIAAIDVKIAGMYLMAVWNWLLGSIADIGIIRRAKIPEEKNGGKKSQKDKYYKINPPFIG
jgi:hypothetical protein